MTAASGAGLLLAVVWGLIVVVSQARPPKSKAPPSWKLHVDLHYVRTCPEHPIMSCPATNYFLNKDGELMYNATCVVSKNVKDITEATFKLTRCRDAVSSNTCEYYKTFQWSIGICELLKINSLPLGQMWSKWSPPMYCPISAGNYTMTNVKINIQDAGKLIDLPGYVWIGTATMRAGNELFDCKTFEFKATKTRA
ncbi:uncharacterized protein LOC113215036 [Frankliniella occidentalis]|uniref:Uncharacterized protein LOC113215036 n=1 Tax=Frankliniella occidentalis TaxID=133901 RepID=A0A6J1TC77_FRAOC|nr:uncharacterized protein LOC113215036 [Frankliniella occidentalis]